MAATVAVIRFELSIEFTLEATFGRVKRYFLRYETGGEPSTHVLIVAANYRPAGVKPAVAKTQEKMLHSVALQGQSRVLSSPGGAPLRDDPRLLSDIPSG